jgi:hypothetical protein
MAEALYLVERTDQPVADDRDGVRAVVINEDDAQTNAQIITATIAALNAALPVSAGAEAKFPAGYFDTVSEISDLVTAGPLRTDGNFVAFKSEVTSART